MKKLYFLLAFFIMVLHACTKEKELDPADVPDSIQQLMTHSCTCEPRIGLFKWEKRLLYMHWYRGAACNTISTYYDEKGRKLDLSEKEQQVFLENKELVKMIWVCGE